MRRRLFTLLAMLSLLLCVATGVIWLRSYDAADVVRSERSRGNVKYRGNGLVSVNGVVTYTSDDSANPAAETLAPAWPPVDISRFGRVYVLGILYALLFLATLLAPLLRVFVLL